MDQQHEEIIDATVRVLRNCKSILFITGAGVSADSGMPTYRGIGGLYDAELTEEGLPIEEILSGPMLRSRPELTWKYLAHIAEAASGASPNRAHEVIAEMERSFERVWTLTQNVDGFHRLAGSQNVIEIHGNMRSLSCMECNYKKRVNSAKDVDDLSLPPKCLECDAILRPDVVLFGEMLPNDAVNRLQRELRAGFGAIFCVGTSGGFPYIQQPVVVARQFGIPTFEINPAETILSSTVDYRLPLGAADALDAIWKRYSTAVGD